MTQPITTAAETFFFDPLAGVRTDAESAAYQAEAAALAATAEPLPVFDPLAGLDRADARDSQPGPAGPGSNAKPPPFT